MNGTMASGVQDSFRGEVKGFVLEELDDLGAVFLIGRLEAVLMEDAGQMVSNGVTPEMLDGSAAATVASADMVAMALGHPPNNVDPEVEAALAPLREELLEEAALADLADRALGIVETSDRFRATDTKGECASEADFLALVAEVRERLGRARLDFPGEWQLAPVDAGVFSVTMYPGSDEDIRP